MSHRSVEPAAPLGGRRTPDIRAPRRGHLGRNIAIAGTLAVAVGTAAFGVSQLNNGRVPGASPESSRPAGIAEQSNSPIPTLVSPSESIVIPSATPEVTPSPTPDMSKWWNQIPPNPYKNVNEVPLAKDSNGFATTGDLEMQALQDTYPYYDLVGANLTILSATPDIKHDQILVTATTGTDVITQEGACSIWVSNGHDVNQCSYTGGTYILTLKQGTQVLDRMTYLGSDLTNIAKYLKVGTVIEAAIVVSPVPGVLQYTNLTTDDIAVNLSTWDKYRNELGAKSERTSTDFVWFPWRMIVYSSN